MAKKITRREAMKDIFILGVGLVSAESLLQACTSSGNAKTSSSFSGVTKSEAPEGSSIDHRNWPALGASVGMLGLGCMRLPSLPGDGGGFGHGGRLDQEAVNAMVDYAIAHGINYFDTAPAYGESERVTGIALKRHPRESFMIATKMSNFAFGPATPTLEAARQMFETSLANLQIDYVDFLLLHNLTSLADFANRFENNGVLDYLKEQKAAGRIKHLGFSYHGDNETFTKILDKYDWEFVQIQLNYADWKDMPSGFGPATGKTSSEYLYNTLAERNIPVVVMEPVKGGALANVSDALKEKMEERHPGLTPAGNALTFVGSLPGVMVTLSGMSNMDQLKENVATFTDFQAFDDREMDFMLTVADLYKSNTHIPCTACSYCMPCPHGVNIPGNFKVFNTASDQLNIPNPDVKDADFKKKRKAFLKMYEGDLDKGSRADACTTCNACLPKCPQHIRIPDQLKMINDLVAKL